MSLNRLFRIVNGVLLALVLVLLWRFAGQEWSAFVRVREGARALTHLQEALRVGEMVSGERAPSAALLGASPEQRSELLPLLNAARQRTDSALAEISQVVRAEPNEAARTVGLDAVRRVSLVVQEVRRAVDVADALPQGASAEREGDLGRLLDAVAQILPLVDGYIARALQSYPDQHAAVRGAQLAAAIGESAGVLELQLRPALLAHRPPNEAELAEIERTRSRMTLLHELLNLQLEMLEPWPEINQASAWVEAAFFGRGEALVKQVLLAGGGAKALAASEFSRRYGAEVNSLLALRDVLIDTAVSHAKARSQEARSALLVAGLLLAVMAACLAGTMWLLHHRVFRPLGQAAQSIEQMAAGCHDVVMPKLGTSDEIGAVMGALQNLQDSQRRAAGLALERDALIHKLQMLSSTDPLTGLLNRRAFFETAERELGNAARHGFEIVVLLLDVDHFKAINDTHGHAVGDQALVGVAGALQICLRQGDLLGRYGGEEFVVLLTHCERRPGLGFGERLRQSVAELVLADEAGGAFSLTISLGLAASADVGLSLPELLSQADAAMYQAKRSGRNQLICLQEAAAPSGEPAAVSQLAVL